MATKEQIFEWIRYTCVTDTDAEQVAEIVATKLVEENGPSHNTGSPKLPLVERAFRDGFITGHFPVSVDVAWKEWQLRAGA